MSLCLSFSWFPFFLGGGVRYSVLSSSFSLYCHCHLRRCGYDMQPQSRRTNSRITGSGTLDKFLRRSVPALRVRVR
ncbi:hypothetical protein BDV24DRAFT_136812 [Aspergillus arachidicola]|uniref:Secreted protein n=1 Tax=Aspergillus arachidicola TaxID=656916 RepID=A0A5N6Y120_9EURO|nr:hypothetical protein BDV24DRAFT_136812 [Aspergillus arachidicola]